MVSGECHTLNLLYNVNRASLGRLCNDNTTEYLHLMDILDSPVL